ncbi:MAG: hypothetical protein HKP48_02965 [Winogradskyella sp.]|uniref:hypothetical protein n=1 Tax=Winogradskyella sp. TaxID=1883156 RepID=UPI001819B259|nr:hypothetical protein [Winogradskyella sp.]MBT8243866.1 hypothetical protein [Winogradskyella sp.]NNK22271.1 hypothetical protein [Winogradskyella sp.]
MSINEIRLIIDSGFLVLIWAVQLVIYPSFGYYSQSNLFKWHQSYTKRVTIIVLPLMFSQLILGIIHLWQTQNWYTVLSMFIIILLWLVTFLIFVPLHQSIDNKPLENVCKKLVKYNWTRTLLWTLLFGITLYYFLSILKNNVHICAIMVA